LILPTMFSGLNRPFFEATYSRFPGGTQTFRTAETLRAYKWSYK